MDTHTAVLAAELAALAVLNVLDVISTNAFLAAKTAKEANPINAWAQRVLGANWWVVKLPMGLLAYGAWWVGPAVPMLLAAGAIDAFYVFTVTENFRVARGK